MNYPILKLIVKIVTDFLKRIISKKKKINNSKNENECSNGYFLELIVFD